MTVAIVVYKGLIPVVGRILTFLKCMTVYMIEFLKRTAGYRGWFHTFLLKKLQILWSIGSPWHNVEVDGNTKAFACA